MCPNTVSCFTSRRESRVEVRLQVEQSRAVQEQERGGKRKEKKKGGGVKFYKKQLVHPLNNGLHHREDSLARIRDIMHHWE